MPRLWFNLLPGYFTHIFWVYFRVPVTQEQKDRVEKSAGIRVPVNLKTPRHQARQPRNPVTLWATRTEQLHSQEVQLLLWPHIWKDKEAADFRFSALNNQTKLDRFYEFLRDVGSIKHKEDFCQFEELRRL